MKRAVISIAAVLASALALTGALRPLSGNEAPMPVRRHTAVSAGSIARALASVSMTGKRRDDDHAAVRRRLKAAEPGTYIADILNERDSSLARWDRAGAPLTVWIQPSARVEDFSDTYVSRVREAFEEWDALELPVRFSFVPDSADAEVHVNWIDHFTQPISGRTRWSRDDDWVITDANIVLALHHQKGDLLDFDAMHAMALHEIGHLLGLDHTADTLSIMAPKVRVRQLSEADRATARLLYALPAGPLR